MGRKAAEIAAVGVVLAGAWFWPPSGDYLRGRLENTLGYVYLSGVGVSPDAAAAVAWYRRGAEHGYAVAAYNLAYLCQTGTGTPASPIEAARWYELAARQKHALAANNLAMMYANGALGARDLAMARVWLKRALPNASSDERAPLARALTEIEHDMSQADLDRSERLAAP